MSTLPTSAPRADPLLATASEPELLAEMTPALLDEALAEVSNAARNRLGSRPSRSWIAPSIEIEGIVCGLEVEMSAFCESLDEPGGPSGWRFRLTCSCVARLTAERHGAAFSGEREMTKVEFDGVGAMRFTRGERLVNDAMDQALTRLRHSQAFASWREAAAITAELPELPEEPEALRISRRL